jgi:short-subunit dehydrogenase
LHHGIPVKVLGNAVFDVPGLTCQASLDAFWRDPLRPDPELMIAFVRALCGTTQIKGGYYEHTSKATAIAGFAERLERGPHPLPELTAQTLAGRPVRPAAQHILVSGLSDGVSLALARAYAAPGISLSLLGVDAGLLAAAAEDCRRRGALVEAVCLDEASEAELGERLVEVHRRTPVDVLAVHAGCAQIGRCESAQGDGQGAAAEVLDAMNTVAALAAPMCERGRGRIVLVSGLIGRTFERDLPALTAGRRALLAYGESLRYRVQAHGLSVTAVVPGDLALRAAARYGQPSLATMSPDRAAERILHGVRYDRPVVAIPCPAAVAMRLICLVPSTLRYWAGNRLFPGGKPAAEPVQEAPLGTGSALGD